MEFDLVGGMGGTDLCWEGGFELGGGEICALLFGENFGVIFLVKIWF